MVYPGPPGVSLTVIPLETMDLILPKTGVGVSVGVGELLGVLVATALVTEGTDDAVGLVVDDPTGAGFKMAGWGVGVSVGSF